jgi:thioredoxin 1
MQEYAGDRSSLGNGTVVLDFYATWCGPCKRLRPILEAYAASRPELTLIAVNTDEWTDLMERFDVSSLPTLVVLKNGKRVDRIEGAPPDGWLDQATRS